MPAAMTGGCTDGHRTCLWATRSGGERPLWTLALAAETAGDGVTLSGRLPRFGLQYQRRVYLAGNRLLCDYRIANPTTAEPQVMWKLHAALAVQPGDRILCPAATARAADPAWSRRPSAVPFTWPEADGLDRR